MSAAVPWICAMGVLMVRAGNGKAALRFQALSLRRHTIFEAANCAAAGSSLERPSRRAICHSRCDVLQSDVCRVGRVAWRTPRPRSSRASTEPQDHAWPVPQPIAGVFVLADAVHLRGVSRRQGHPFQRGWRNLAIRALELAQGGAPKVTSISRIRYIMEPNI